MMKHCNVLVMLLLATAALSGCSSGAKKETPAAHDSQAQNSGEEEGVPPVIAGESGEETEKAPPAPQSTMIEYYKKFNDARLSRNYKAAQDAAGEILARNPNDLKILNALAIMAIEQGKFDLARLLLGKVLAKDPNNTSALNNLGLVEFRTDNLRLALAKFKRAVEIDSGNRAAHANLGNIYLQYRNYPNAATELQAAVDNGDKGLDTLNNLGIALTHTGKYDQAVDTYERAISKDANNPTVLLNYSVLLVEHVNRPKKAMKFLNKIRLASNDSAILEKVNQLAKRAETASKGSTEKESSD
jgi:Tfp pilus assembly protein PilF